MTMLVGTETVIHPTTKRSRTVYVFLRMTPHGYLRGRSLTNDPATVEMWIETRGGWGDE